MSLVPALFLVFGIVAGAFASASVAQAATPVPPFTQCPPVGLDTGCQILIVYNADGTVVTLIDPLQPSFDGVEDTLIGVQNNSPVSISSTPLSGVGIFAFDNDGLCDQSIRPSGCPYDPTHYAGRTSTTAVASTAPGNGDSFTVNGTCGITDTCSGSVNYSPPIKPGGSAYFSLEGKATSLQFFCLGIPVKVLVSPTDSIDPVNTKHTETATVTDNCGKPVAGVTVSWTVAGSVNTTGTCTTTVTGACSFTYQGPILPGQDLITACAGANGGPPCGATTKTWVLPVSSPNCTIDITQGGWMIANDLDKVSFGGTVHTDQANAPSGEEQYTDKPADLDVHSIDILVITCSPDLELADIYGQATINNAATSHLFRIEVEDRDSTGGSDSYWIFLDTGYDSGKHDLGGGHVEIHPT